MAPRHDGYSGHLSPFVDVIVDAYGRGLAPRQIAQRLYDAGARTGSSDPSAGAPADPGQQVANLASLTLHVLKRLGLRQPRSRRQLTARKRTGRDGETIWET
jgi:hypothetical protein